MEFRVLGGVRAQVDGAPVDLGRRRERCLLGVLLLQVNTPVSIESLVELLGEELTRNQVHVHVSRLRKALAGTSATLRSERGGYTLLADPDRIDVHRFRALVAAARESDRPLAPLREAFALWRGPALGADTTDAVRQRFAGGLDELFLAATGLRLTAELAAGEYAAVLPELAALTAAHPLRETFAALRVTALHRTGRRADALAAYDTARERLAEATGLDPGPELAAAHQRVLHEVAPVRAPAQLPPDLADFTGREHELDRLDALLPTGGGTVVISTVTGTGGIGKTTLAVHWAHRIRDRFPDGQLHLNLHGYSTSAPVPPTEALARLLRALGVPSERIPPHLEEAAGMYRSLLADRRVLILLDNAHHPDQVRPLLPSSPHCMVLVTSRDALTGLVVRDGAVVLELPVLSADEATEFLRSVLGPDTVAAEPEATAELIALCGRLPLALRITAAHLLDRPGIAAHVARMRGGDLLGALEVDDDPQASVRTAFDLSYAALAPEAARLFRFLGLVPGADLTAGAARALAGADPDRLLRQLTAAHLVGESGGRYALHDLLRRYAEERVADDPERHEAAARLHDWYLYTTDAAAFLYGTASRLPLPPRPDSVRPDEGTLSWLESERANLVALIRHAAAHGPHQLAWQLADALRGYFYQRRYPVDWLAASDAATAAAEASGDERARASAYLGRGTLHLVTNDAGQAAAYYARALELADSAGWTVGAAAATNNLGDLLLRQGRYREAHTHLERAVATLDVSGRHLFAAILLSNLADACRWLGRTAEAESHLERAVDHHDQAGSVDGSGHTLTVLGRLLTDTGDPAGALVQLEQALVYIGIHASREFEVEALNASAEAHHAEGRAGEATGLYRRSIELARDIDYVQGEADGLLGLSALAGSPAEALAAAGRALDLAVRIDHVALRGRALTAMAEAHLAAGDTGPALDAVGRGLASHEESGYHAGLVRSRQLLDVIRAAAPNPATMPGC
ncbi:BTAD domain-containing putative transcriptional regulator [Longispora sp. NPDC051575]|uniref:AfsR/SARP family transcriptional regulator n=1 Tax=Longispora sp. NPDC051575 TaxID=3154943 RepID=UPI00343BF8B8